MKLRSRLANVLLVLEGAALALAVGTLVFARAGFLGSPVSYVVVSGHSMEPTLHAGDVVVLQRTSSYGTGDVIAYHVPEGEPGAGLIVIHRIVGGNPGKGYVMKGDNKNAPDPWRPRRSEIVGRERLLVPKIGLAVGYIRTPLGLAGLAGLLTLAIALCGQEASAASFRSGRRGRIVPTWRQHLGAGGTR
ncbi:MAG TPA: signal peptidase I [Gaiellaceae bacterium]|nr:signal peptidase I [Gaiellaceae bacterium]